MRKKTFTYISPNIVNKNTRIPKATKCLIIQHARYFSISVHTTNIWIYLHFFEFRRNLNKQFTFCYVHHNQLLNMYVTFRYISPVLDNRRQCDLSKWQFLQSRLDYIYWRIEKYRYVYSVSWIILTYIIYFKNEMSKKKQIKIIKR